MRTSCEFLANHYHSVKQEYHSFSLSFDNIIKTESFVYIHFDKGVKHLLLLSSKDQGLITYSSCT